MKWQRENVSEHSLRIHCLIPWQVHYFPCITYLLLQESLLDRWSIIHYTNFNTRLTRCNRIQRSFLLAPSFILNFYIIWFYTWALFFFINLPLTSQVLLFICTPPPNFNFIPFFIQQHNLLTFFRKIRD